MATQPFTEMNFELAFVLALLFACVAAFVAGRPRMDAVAACAFVVLVISGIVEPEEAFAAFSDSSVIIIALMFVISSGLAKTGVSAAVGDWILRRAGKSEAALIAMLMCSVALLGSVMSTTGVVAIFIPVTLGICRRRGIPPSKLMMPLAFAGIISGMTTLVATSPNLITNGALVKEGYEGFGFFEVTPIGLTVLAAGIAYMLVVRRFLPDGEPENRNRGARRKLSDFVRDYRLESREKIFEVMPDSPLAGMKISEFGPRAGPSFGIICIERKTRRERALIEPAPETEIAAGDLLLCDLRDPLASEIPTEFLLRELPLSGGYFSERSAEIGMAEIAILPESALIGQTLTEAKFRSAFGLNAIGLRRNSAAVGGSILSHRLRVGDILLVFGKWGSIRSLKSRNRDFIILNLPEESETAAVSPGRAGGAILSLLVMVALMATGAAENVVAAAICCLMMVSFKCLSMDEAYKSVYWPALILIICMMPFAAALEKTGGVKLAADTVLGALGGYGETAVTAGLFALAMLTVMFIANTVTAILFAPIAIAAAQTMGADPHGLEMAVAVASSTAFMTPLSSPVNMLVMNPGGYKFKDFFKFGAPFSIIVMIISLFWI